MEEACSNHNCSANLALVRHRKEKSERKTEAKKNEKKASANVCV